MSNSNPSNEKWIKAVTKLIELTQKEKISWKKSNHRDNSQNLYSLVQQDRIMEAYEATYLGRRLVLKRRLPSDIIVPFGFLDHYDQLIDRHSKFTLESLDNQGKVMDSFPEIDALKHLLNEARAQCTDMNLFVNELLNTENT